MTKRRQRTLIALLAIVAIALPLVRYWQNFQLNSHLSAASISELIALAEAEPDDARIPTELGRRFLLEQRYREARRALDKALNQQPEFSEALYLKGLLHYYERDPVAAMEMFEQAIKHEDKHGAAHLHLGMVYVERSEFKKALEVLKQYAKLEPMDPAGHYWLGVAAFTSGYEKTGIWAMERAVKLEPEVGTYHLALGGFYLNSRDGQRLLPKAQAELEEAVRLAPEDWMTHFRLAAAYLRGNRLRQAAERLEEAIRLQPNAYEPYFLLPQVYGQLGNAKKAEHYRRIAESLRAADKRRREKANGRSGKPS